MIRLRKKRSTAQEDHQQKILETFQAAWKARERAAELAARADRIRADTEVALDAARKDLRRVLDGII